MQSTISNVSVCFRMSTSELSINFIKASAKTSKAIDLAILNEVFRNCQLEFKAYPNFTVLTIDMYKFTVFKQSKNSNHNHVNIAGLKKFQEIDEAINSFNKILFLIPNIEDVTLISWTCDNISAASKVHGRLNLRQVMRCDDTISKQYNAGDDKQ